MQRRFQILLCTLAICAAALLLWSQVGAAQSASLIASPEVVGPSDSVIVSYQQSDPTGNDWVSLDAAGRPDGEYYDWQFALGREGSLTFAHPRAPSVWEFRLFRNGTRIATSNTITFYNGWQLIAGAKGGISHGVAVDKPREWYFGGSGRRRLLHCLPSRNQAGAAGGVGPQRCR
jgi:hypothetical protein